MPAGLFTDETIKKHILKYGKENYIKDIHEKLKKGEEEYKRGKRQLSHILERIEKDFR